MKRPRLLVSWIGHTDYLAMASRQDETTQRRVFAALRRESSDVKPPGPIQTALEQESFDGVHLLSNDPEWLSALYAKAVAPGATVHRVELNDPTDYGPVFAAAEGV